MRKSSSSEQLKLELVNDVPVERKIRRVGVNQKVEKRIQRRKEIEKANNTIASNLKMLAKLNNEILVKIGEATKIANPTEEQIKNVKILKRIEEERLNNEMAVAVRRWHLTADKTYMVNTKKRIPPISNEKVRLSIVQSFCNVPDVHYTNFKISLNKHKQRVKQVYEEWKKAIENPDNDLRFRDYTPYQANKQLKVLSQILTAFDVIINLTSFYSVGSADSIQASCSDTEYRPYVLDPGNWVAKTPEECLLMRKKQEEYYLRLSKRRFKDQSFSVKGGTFDFSDVTKFQNLKPVL